NENVDDIRRNRNGVNDSVGLPVRRLRLGVVADCIPIPNLKREPEAWVKRKDLVQVVERLNPRRESRVPPRHRRDELVLIWVIARPGSRVVRRSVHKSGFRVFAVDRECDDSCSFIPHMRGYYGVRLRPCGQGGPRSSKQTREPYRERSKSVEALCGN